MTVHVFLKPPPDFKPEVEVAGTYCEYQGRILFLKRHISKVQGLRWGIPAGKLEPGEKPVDAAFRELFEEAGIQASHLEPIDSLYIRRPEIDFIFHMFFLPLNEFPLLKIAPEEHTEACWVNLQEAQQLPLVTGGLEALEYFYLWKSKQHF